MDNDVKWLNEREERTWRALQFMQMRLEAEIARQLTSASALSYPDYLVLLALTDKADGRSRSFELAQLLGWEKSRLSHQVTRMAGRGLVKKDKCGDDGRGAYVKITAKGRREIEAAAPGHVATVRRLFIDVLTNEQLEVIGEAAEAVLSKMQSESGN